MPTNFIYDEKRNRYRRPDGRFVKASEVRRAADKYIDAKQEKGRELFNLLREGKISVKDAQLIGERQIAIAHGNAAMAVRGGRNQMTPSHWGKVGNIVKGELGHWRDKMKEIADGAPLDGRVRQSFEAYFANTGATWSKTARDMLSSKGFDEVRNILGDTGRSCSECPDITAKGWMPYSEWVERGSRQCNYNCRCGEEHRNSETGEVWS